MLGLLTATAAALGFGPQPLPGWCPDSKALIHASCAYTIVAQASCSDVVEEIVARGTGKNGWYDPHNRGTYHIDSSSTSPPDVTGHRESGSNCPGCYTDKLHFQMKDGQGTRLSGPSCTISACSVSQVTSVKDFSGDYCNLHDLVCGSNLGCKHVLHDFAITESFPAHCPEHDVSNCLKVAAVEQ